MVQAPEINWRTVSRGIPTVYRGAGSTMNLPAVPGIMIEHTNTTPFPLFCPAVTPTFY
jgi:hypothetical protein